MSYFLLVALLCFSFAGLDGPRVALCDVALVFVFSRFLSNSGRCPRRYGTTRSLPGTHESLTSYVTLALHVGLLRCKAHVWLVVFLQVIVFLGFRAVFMRLFLPADIVSTS